MINIHSIGESIFPIVDVSPGPPGEIEKIDLLGTGVYIGSGLVLTCAHVLRSAKSYPASICGTVYSQGKERLCGLTDIKYHEHVDLALARVSESCSNLYQPLALDLREEKVLGDDYTNYSFPEAFNSDFKIFLRPRFLKGYLVRTAFDLDTPAQHYLEVSFSSVPGMSGSPILNSLNEIVGIVYQNFESRRLVDEECVQESIDGEKEPEIMERTYRVSEFAKAIDLSKYPRFLDELK